MKGEVCLLDEEGADASSAFLMFHMSGTENKILKTNKSPTKQLH